MKKKYLLNKYPMMADARMIKEAGQDIPKQEKKVSHGQRNV